MSTHPNTILLLVLKPDGLSRKSRRDILADGSVTEEDGGVTIGGSRFRIAVMEDDCDVVVFDVVTYGYGEKIEWDDELAALKDSLQEWAIKVCEKYNYTSQIYVTANYW